jgi:hypothetical protein
MPPPAVKTVRDLIYWEYAKLIAGSAVGDRRNYRFDMYEFQKLKKGNIHPSTILRENKKFYEMEHECAYCGSKESTLEYDHIIPRHKIVIDTIDNMVLACRHCNATKGDRDPFEWYGLEKRYEIPRIVLGKYLKLIYEIHERQGTLERTNFKPGVELNIYDLGVILPSKTE